MKEGGGAYKTIIHSPFSQSTTKNMCKQEISSVKTEIKVKLMFLS